MKKTLITIATTLSAILIVSTATYAIGSLTPTGTAGDDTQYSLNDIYDKLTNFTDTPTATSSPFTVPGSVSASFHTLSEIYSLLQSEDADLVAANIVTGTTIFGVEGTASAGSPNLTWQTDPTLSLCWSAGQYEIDNGCSIGNGWTAEGYGAVEYCQNLVAEGSSEWRLPTIQEYQSITDFTAYNNATQVPGFSQFAYYWSGTPFAESPDNLAWLWATYIGNMFNFDRGSQFSVRCVH